MYDFLGFAELKIGDGGDELFAQRLVLSELLGESIHEAEERCFLPSAAQPCQSTDTRDVRHARRRSKRDGLDNVGEVALLVARRTLAAKLGDRAHDFEFGAATTDPMASVQGSLSEIRQEVPGNFRLPREEAPSPTNGQDFRHATVPFSEPFGY